MRTYFVTADIHSYFDIFKKELYKQGFDLNNENHYLIICGDLFDRGNQSKELLNWLLELNKTGRLMLIRGNHEDLFDMLLKELKQGFTISQHHIHNGTVDTLSQLTGISLTDLYTHNYKYEDIIDKLKDYHLLINNCKDYYEIGNYVFVHGWVPYTLQDSHDPSQQENEFSCIMIPEISLNAEKFMWESARWYNGMREWYKGIIIPGKTIVCGHWHTSFANYEYHNKGSGEFEKDSDFGPFIDEGIIALDACTAFSGKINVIKLKI